MKSNKFTKLIKDKKGATMVEYAILLFLILVVAAVVYKAVGTKVKDAGTKTSELSSTDLAITRNRSSSRKGRRAFVRGARSYPGDARHASRAALPSWSGLPRTRAVWYYHRMIYFLGAAVLVAAIAAIIDWRTGEIPNWLTLGPLVIAPLAYGAVALLARRNGCRGSQLVGTAVLGVFVCSLVPLLLYRQNAHWRRRRQTTRRTWRDTWMALGCRSRDVFVFCSRLARPC